MPTFTSDGTENRMRWDRSSRGFMEVWYVTLNHGPTGAGVWLRYTITAPDEQREDPYCELWGFLFPADGTQGFAGKTRFPIDRLGAPNGRDDGALVRIGDAWLSENHLEGEVQDAQGSLTWSLDFDPSDRCFQHLPAALRGRIERRVSTVCSPNLAVPFTGTVKLNERLFEFDRDEGCQSHRWGRRHAISWAWGHCSTFEEGDALFEGVAAKASLGPIKPTTTFLYLEHEGNEISFNEPKWALRARSRYEMPTWAFTAHNEDWKIAGAARAKAEKLVQVTYVDPDGSPRYCANSEIASLAIEIYRRSPSGWRHYGSLTSMSRCHLEFGREEPFAELPIAF